MKIRQQVLSLGVLILSFTVSSSSYAQADISLSARFGSQKQELKGTFPPRLFLTFISHDTSRFHVGFECFINHDTYKRNWPDLGSYSVNYKEFGAGLITKFRIMEFQKFSMEFVAGCGPWAGNYSISQNNSLLSQYLIPPKSKSGFYGFAGLGCNYKLGESSIVWAHIGSGFNRYAIGYTYRTQVQ